MVRIGIIGAGGNGSGHARYFQQSERAEVVAVADPDTERASELAAELDVEPLPDFREFLPDVDAAVISSPSYLHRDHAVACAEAGKHILCEKPMGLNAAEADQIVEAVQEAGVVCLVGFSVRFGAVVQTMQREIQQGRVGELISIWSRRLCLTRRPRRGWRGDHSLSGGVLFEINIHELDWMMSIGGKVDSVYGRTYAETQTGRSANDHFWCILQFASGAVGSHEGSQITPSAEFRSGIIGTEGSLITDRWRTALYRAERGGEDRELELEPKFDKRAHFLDCIEEGTQNLSSAQWGRQVVRVADAILESASIGQVVTL